MRFHGWLLHERPGLAISRAAKQLSEAVELESLAVPSHCAEIFVSSAGDEDSDGSTGHRWISEFVVGPDLAQSTKDAWGRLWGDGRVRWSSVLGHRDSWETILC